MAVLAANSAYLANVSLFVANYSYRHENYCSSDRFGNRTRLSLYGERRLLALIPSAEIFYASAIPGVALELARKRKYSLPGKL
jgi:hypothetical protein